MSEPRPAKSPAQSDSSDDEDGRRRRKPTNALEAQKLQLERLMNRIDKPIQLPENREKPQKGPRDFVRNVQGSSAGAGSGEFHVYRALRRKEYARQKQLDEEAKEAEEKRAYQEKMEAIRRMEEEKTAKKREKRKRKKANAATNTKKVKVDSTGSAAGSEGSRSSPKPLQAPQMAESQGLESGPGSPGVEDNAGE
ncbi:hypothetical protein HK104_007705 [Borealophlyctis nickersoniae]|nr:hypothetical protein HK104_007705 [Borealophlyctis nickersoniae]